MNPWSEVMKDVNENHQALSEDMLTEKNLDHRFPSPFIYFNSWNLYPFIYLKSEKGTRFGPIFRVPSQETVKYFLYLN